MARPTKTLQGHLGDGTFRADRHVSFFATRGGGVDRERETAAHPAAWSAPVMTRAVSPVLSPDALGHSGWTLS
jgi:hypothetical protein